MVEGNLRNFFSLLTLSLLKFDQCRCGLMVKKKITIIFAIGFLHFYIVTNRPKRDQRPYLVLFQLAVNFLTIGVHQPTPIGIIPKTIHSSQI